MRLPVRTGSLALLTLWLFGTPAAPAEVTRTIRGELAAGLSRFAVENLAGTMSVKTGSGASVVAVATVHAENEELAGAVRLEQVAGEGGIPTLSVRYPLDRTRTIRYPDPRSSHEWEILDFFSTGSRYRYAGTQVRVSHNHGVLLYADVEVQVPRGQLDAVLRNLVGLLEARGLEGRLRFEVESADLDLDALSGDLELRGSSGDIRARDIRGGWKSRFSSGDCVLERFEGEVLAFHTSSGDIHARSIKARRIEVETSSGDARIQDADAAELAADSSSGDIEFDSIGGGLKSVNVETSSGDVALRLPREASFEADADQSSGDLTVGFSDGTGLWHGEKLTGYRRGNGGSQIRLHTSSGDASIEPR